MIIAHNQFEVSLWKKGYTNVIGIDEVGRGAWAGPLVVASVMFPVDFTPKFNIADSKLLSKKRREELSIYIKEVAKDYKIIEKSVSQINQEGLGTCIQSGSLESIKQLKITPDYVLIDAFLIKNYPTKKQTPIIKGDQQSISIAAASIIAKVYRDNLMNSLSDEVIGYSFSKNVGYGTKEHQSAIAKIGMSTHHRTSFNLSKYLTKNVS
ncbi:MAG: ribonuclease HII [bacterium]|nr:ribonuclease HII [bacterium]